MRAEIERLRGDFSKVGGLALEMTRLGGNAYFTGDRKTAMQVVDLEKRINRDEVQLEGQCQTLLAVQRLDAPEVRWVLSILRSAVDLERVGDYCFKLAMRARERGAPLSHPQEPALKELSGISTAMLANVLNAFAENNRPAAREVGRNDEATDNLKNQIGQAIQEAWRAGRGSPADYEVLLTSLDLERIADHATNIAEEVMVLTSGTIERHVIRREHETL